MEHLFYDESGQPVDVTEIQWAFDKAAGQWHWTAWSGALKLFSHAVPPEKLTAAMRTTGLLLCAMVPAAVPGPQTPTT